MENIVNFKLSKAGLGLWGTVFSKNIVFLSLFTFSNRRRQPSGSSLSSLGLPGSLSPSPQPPDSPFASPKVQRHERQNIQGK